jgi:PAS domain S-box-containing protein
VLLGHRPVAGSAISGLTPNGGPIEIADLSEIAAPAMADALPDEWCFVVPLAARDRTLGVLVTTAARGAPLSGRDRLTLERLSASLALALDALLLDDEERLAREREHLLATALTTIDHPIFILDRMGVRYANPAAAREYGWTQAELMEMNFDRLVASVDARPERRVNAAFVESGVSLAEHVHRRRDGSEFPAAVTVSPLASHDGERIGQVVSVRNVSTDRRMAEQLRTTEKMVALGELVGGVAHEINNPLTGISAFAQMLLEETLTDDQRESVRLIKQESDRAKTVIRDLLIFARTTEHGSGPVDVNDVIEHALRLRAYPLRQTGVELLLELDPSAPRVRGDSQKLQQVLLNIIGNAEFAMHAVPVRRLTLRTRADAQAVHIEAIDTGTGMPPDVRRRIFEPFFTTKTEGVGTGLGLSVSYGIVQAHGGTIDVHSEAGVGTSVSISLPLSDSSTPPPA